MPSSSLLEGARRVSPLQEPSSLRLTKTCSNITYQYPQANM